MSTSLFPWQGEVWQQLQQMRARLPHAILFHGAEGIGKTKPGMDCPGAKSKKVIACLQPDRKVDVEVIGTKAQQ